MEIKTEFAINDAVFTASSGGVNRDIIKRIKIGPKNKIEYGFRSVSTMGMFFGDDLNWYGAKDVFATEAEADKRHLVLKAKYEAERAKEGKEAQEKRIIKAKAELEAAKKGLEPDYEW